MTVIDEIAVERRRQIEQEGWHPKHDDTHAGAEMARAAMAYVQAASAGISDTSRLASRPPTYWPWAPAWWKPKNPRRDLIRAAALIVAEIERLDRAAKETPA
jgi:hypothetical protein